MKEYKKKYKMLLYYFYHSYTSYCMIVIVKIFVNHFYTIRLSVKIFQVIFKHYLILFSKIDFLFQHTTVRYEGSTELKVIILVSLL